MAVDGEILAKCEEESCVEYGSKPEERPIAEYVRNGLVVLDKPRGPTSHQTSAWVKEILGLGKAGHSGTLDPNVSGVLPVALEDATKMLDFLLTSDKEYVAVMRLHSNTPSDKLEKTLKYFQGEIYQKPPLKSAVKRQLRTRKLYKIELVEADGRDVLVKVRCEAGTYIRKLVHDIGLVLGVGAHMQELRRTRAALFTEREAVTLHDLRDAHETFIAEKDDSLLRKTILPVEYAVRDFKKIWIKDTAVDALCHGANLNVPGICLLNAGVRKGTLVALMTLKQELIAVGESLFNAQDLMKKRHGVAVELRRVLMKPGTYPKKWKTKQNQERQ